MTTIDGGSALTAIFQEAEQKLALVKAGEDVLMNSSLALRSVIKLATCDDVRNASDVALDRVSAKLIELLPVIESETVGFLQDGHVQFAVEAAIGLMKLFGGAHDKAPRIEFTAIVLDRIDYTALLASELEGEACRRDIAARGYVLRTTAAALADGRFGSVLQRH